MSKVCSPSKKLMDRRYGRVRDLACVLGYGEEDKVHPRCWRVLNRSTNEFRKKFSEELNNRLPPVDFPLDFYHPEAQDCALAFLNKHKKMFQWIVTSGQSYGDTKWTGEIENHDHALEILSKLMCTQEFKYQQNLKNLVKADRESSDFQERGSPRVSKPTEKALHTKSAPRPSRLFSTDSASDLSEDSESEDAHVNYDNDLTDVDDRVNDERFLESDLARSNIQIHLDWIFPLEAQGPHESGWQWLVTPKERWPEALEPFTFRYMHEHCLYHTNQKARPDVEKFVALLKMKLGFPKQVSKETTVCVYNKVRKFISGRVRKWKVENRHHPKGSYGFLYEDQGVLKKSKVFREAWSSRRQQWFAQQLPRLQKHPPELLKGNKRRQTDEIEARHNSLDASSPASGISKRTKQYHMTMDSEPELEADALLRPTANMDEPIIVGMAAQPMFGGEFFAPRASMYSTILVPAVCTSDSIEVLPSLPIDGLPSINMPRDNETPISNRQPHTIEIPNSSDTPSQCLDRDRRPYIGNTPFERPSTSAQPSTSLTESTEINISGNQIPAFTPTVPPEEPAQTTSTTLSSPKIAPILPTELESTSQTTSLQSTGVTEEALNAMGVHTPAPPPPPPQQEQQQNQPPKQSEEQKDGQQPAPPSKNQNNRPSKPSFSFLLIDGEGSLHRENLISVKAFRRITLEDFLKLVETKRAGDQGSLTAVEFIQRWGKKTSYRVEATSSVGEWSDIQGMIVEDCTVKRDYDTTGSDSVIWARCIVQAADVQGDNVSDDDDDW